MGSGGEPLWPVNYVGSLSHTSTHVAALVARATRHTSVGVDLDDGRLLGVAAAGELMTEFEVEAVLAEGWTVDAEIAPNLAFLVKEALYKYQYPKTRFRELGFRRSGYIGRRRVCGHSRLWRGALAGNYCQWCPIS